jgi:hypothetical protein
MSDWWAKKLGQPAPPRQDPAPTPQAIPPHQRPMAQVPQQYAPEGQMVQAPLPQQPLAGPDPENLTQALQTKTYSQVPDQAKAQRKSGTCPDCGSGNYYRDERHQHCHDCGYPIVQAGSGMGTLGGAGIIATGGTHQAQSPSYDQQLGG